MTCVRQPSIPDGFPTGAASGTPPTVTLVCNPGYTLSDNPRYTGTNPHLTVNAQCISMFIKDGIGKLNARFTVCTFLFKINTRIDDLLFHFLVLLSIYFFNIFDFEAFLDLNLKI